MNQDKIFLGPGKSVWLRPVKDEQGIRFQLEYDTRKKNVQILIENIKSNLDIQEKDGEILIMLDNSIYAKYTEKEGIDIVRKLFAYDIRRMSNSKIAKPIPNKVTEDKILGPKTDLHTHFAGVLSPDVLIEIGLKNNISIPVRDIEKIGIDTSKYIKNSKDMVALSDINSNEEDIYIYKDLLRISTGTQVTFNKMEDVYSMRQIFSKDKALFADMLLEIAKYYKKTGVEYVELSHSAIIGSTKIIDGKIVSEFECLKIAHEVLPKIEEATGVKIRFLAALWRHSDQEWNLDEIDRIKVISQSPYVVGIDFMGRESNSTKNFSEELRTLARWSMENNPDFIIRVHAGESSIYKDNIKDVFKIIIDEHSEFEKAKCRKVPYPKVRIGHGLYGVDDEVLSKAKEIDAVIEFNVNSNLSLNNINELSDGAFKQYLNNGVLWVHGTDGSGIYGNSPKDEERLGRAIGESEEQVRKMRELEERIIEEDRIRFEIKIKELNNKHENFNVQKHFVLNRFSTLTGEPRFNEHIVKERQKSKVDLEKKLADKIKEIGAKTGEAEIKKATEGKCPILITGASESSWPKISPKNQQEITELMKILTDVLNPKTTYIVTGGTNHGVEKEMHKAVYIKNKDNNDKFAVLGTFTKEAMDIKTNSIELNTITHGAIMYIKEKSGEVFQDIPEGRPAETWQDLPVAVLDFIQKNKGQMIAIGGGQCVADMIMEAHNMKNIDIHLMEGPEGASSDKVKKILSGNGYGFQGAKELLTRLYNKNPELFKPEFSLNKVEDYIKAAKSEIMKARAEELGKCMQSFEGYDHNVDKSRIKVKKIIKPDNPAIVF